MVKRHYTPILFILHKLMSAYNGQGRVIVMDIEKPYFEELIPSVLRRWNCATVKNCLPMPNEKEDWMVLLGMKALSYAVANSSKIQDTATVFIFNTEQFTRPEVHSKFHDLIANLKSTISASRLQYCDYSHVNIDLYNDKTAKIIHVPYEPLEDDVECLKSLLAKTPKKWDFGIVGSPGNYRHAMAKRFEDSKFSVNRIFNIFGIQRDIEIASCKALLNVHFDSTYMVFEQARCNRWCAAGMIVISEWSLDNPRTCFEIVNAAQPTTLEPQLKRKRLEKKRPLVSFIIRTRNEEKVILGALMSIKTFANLMPPDTVEVIVVLHLCTDGTEEKVKKFQEVCRGEFLIEVVKYEFEISRAGLENFITAHDSPHSMVQYTRFCYGLANGNWKFRYDADFEMSFPFQQELKTFLLKGDNTDVKVAIPYVSDDGTSGKECYLTNAFKGVTKIAFWELVEHSTDAQVNFNEHLIHRSHMADAKLYWHAEPWFMREFGEEAQALKKLYTACVETIGPEPLGCARANNPECGVYLKKVQDFFSK